MPQKTAGFVTPLGFKSAEGFVQQRANKNQIPPPQPKVSRWTNGLQFSGFPDWHCSRMEAAWKLQLGLDASDPAISIRWFPEINSLWSDSTIF